MSNGHMNCIYGVCCPPGSDKQRAALAADLTDAYPELSDTAPKIAAWVLKNFDLAPPGSLQPLKDEIARLARENPQPVATPKESPPPKSEL